MVFIIGLVTMTVLVWVIASSLGRLSDARKRRARKPVGEGRSRTSGDAGETFRPAA